MDRIYKQYFSVTKSIDEEARTVTHFITTSDLDRTMDVVLPQGGNVANYLAGGGVVLWAHEDDDAPIGKCISLEMTETGWIATTQFYEHEEAEKLWQIVRQGGLKTWSMGFIPIQVRFEGDIRIIETWELLEYSLVNIPANPMVLSKGYRDTGFKEFIEELKALGTDEAKRELSDIRMDAAIATIRVKVDEIKSYKAHCDKTGQAFSEKLGENLTSLAYSITSILGEEDEVATKDLPSEDLDQQGNDGTENGDQSNNATSDPAQSLEPELVKALMELRGSYRTGQGAVLDNFAGRTV